MPANIRYIIRIRIAGMLLLQLYRPANFLLGWRQPGWLTIKPPPRP